MTYLRDTLAILLLLFTVYAFGVVAYAMQEPTQTFVCDTPGGCV